MSGHPGAVRSAGPRRRDKGIVEQCCIKGCDLQHLEHYCAKPKRERRHTRHTRHTPSTLHMVRLLTFIYCFLDSFTVFLRLWPGFVVVYIFMFSHVFTLMTVGYVWCLILCRKCNYKRIKSNTHRSLMDRRLQQLVRMLWCKRNKTLWDMLLKEDRNLHHLVSCVLQEDQFWLMFLRRYEKNQFNNEPEKFMERLKEQTRYRRKFGDAAVLPVISEKIQKPSQHLRRRRTWLKKNIFKDAKPISIRVMISIN